MSVNSRKPCESEYYEPSQYIELHVNKVPAAQNSTKPTSGSIGDNEFSTNRIINQLISTPQTPNVTDTQFEPRKYPELEVNNVAAMYNQQISVSPADQNPTSNSGSIDNEFSSNININQLIYPLQTPNFSETQYKPHVTTSAYNSVHSGYLIDNNINTDQSLSETLLNIQKELVANNFMLNRLLSKVEILESNSKLNNGFSSTTNQYIDSNFLSLFPMKTKEEFLSIENKSVNELDFLSKLESFIRSIGGCGSKNNITRVLQKIFVDEFAVIATLTGRGKNISVALGNSKIIKLVKSIIKANSNNVLTDSEYETVVLFICLILGLLYKKKKDISDVSSKYFKQLLKAEQKKFGNISILPTVSSFNVTDCVKTVLPRSQTTVVDILTHVADCSNIIDQRVASNYCIPYVDNYSKLQVTNDTPLLISNNATQNLNLTDKLRSLIFTSNSLLISEQLDVPKDVRTLMKTPKNQEIVAVSGGSYMYI
ncbi:hypothetical protein QTP88_021017 [Uroleucon formosanum]